MIAIRPLARDEFGKVAELDVTEEGSVVHAWCGEQIVSEWPANVEKGGAVLGAVDGNRLARVAVLVPHLSETLRSSITCM